MKLIALGSFINPSREKVTFVEYLKNPRISTNMKKLEIQWDSKDTLRIIVDLQRRDVYVFPYWVLHSSFLENELQLDYETLMDGDTHIFASIQNVDTLTEEEDPKYPYAITESSQFFTLLRKLESVENLQEYLEENLYWIRDYGIEPTQYLKIPKTVSI